MEKNDFLISSNANGYQNILNNVHFIWTKLILEFEMFINIFENIIDFPQLSKLKKKDNCTLHYLWFDM